MVMVQVRTYFSIQHLQSAYLLSTESKKIEDAFFSEMEGAEKVKLLSKNMALVTGSLFATTSFLEATIREIICDIIEEKDRITYLPLEERKTIELEWNKKGRARLEKIPILKKYQKTLELLHQCRFDNESTPYKDLDTLIKVRNTLVHYTPENYSVHSPFLSENQDQYGLTDLLDGKFDYSVFYKNSGNPFFPDKCLGYGFSQWALVNAVSLVDDFHNRIGLEPIYDHVRET